MSDLISRSALLKEIEKYKFGAISNDAEREYIKKTIFDFINFQPTAYSVDKVVKELKELKMRYFLTIANTGDEKSDFAYENVGNVLDKAIEIVKQGGVSDDVCEKMQMQAYNKAVDNCLKILYFHQNEYDGIQWAIREIEELKEMERD